MATITPKKLFTPQQLPATSTLLYTCPANTKCTIKKLDLCNSTANARTYTVYIVESAGTAGSSNIIASAVVIGPGESTFCCSGMVLNAGDKIYALADSASAVTIHGSGAETT